MWGGLATSHDLTTDNDNLSNKPYSCLGLLANLEDLLIPVDSGLIISRIFDPLYPSRDGIPLGGLGGF